MKNTLILIIVFLSYFVQGQENLFVTDYTWDEVPKYDLAINSNEDMLALKEKYVTEFAFGKNETFVEYYLVHKALLLNSNDKIEESNKVYLPYQENSVLLESKARVITREGKTIELDDSKILTAQNEETGRNYKYFAFEGVEKGSVIEYYYVEKKNPDYRGSMLRLQSEYDKRNVEFDLFAPSNLVFKFKTYNGLPEIQRDSTTKNRLHWSLKVNKLDGIQEEDQAPIDASRAYLVYKLDKNTSSNKTDLSSYGNVAQNIYNYYYAPPDKKTLTYLERFLEKTLQDEKDTESKIRKVDNHIKSSFILSKSGGESLEDLKEILVKKVANSSGMIRLYTAILSNLGIKNEIVLTTDRAMVKFDKDFEAHNFLTDFLMYFPDFKTYLSPTDMQSRYGYPPTSLTDNYGLFIKEVSLGSFKSGIGKIKYIEPPHADQSVDEMIIDVEFDPNNITSNTVKLARSLSGYSALPIQPYMNLIVGENRENMIESLAKTMSENIKITKGELVNDKPELFGIKPIKFLIDVTSEAFVEKAGKKYLFKVGDLIGPQMEMYQEKKRLLPLENEHQRIYYRTININLPKGYKVANLDELNIDNRYSENGKELFLFNSYYNLKDGVLSITADEFYRTNIVPPAIFEEYRTVINSAADFNKIILILEPEE